VHGGFCDISGGQWWCSAWSWVLIFDILGVNGGVMHGLGFEVLSFGDLSSQIYLSVSAYILHVHAMAPDLIPSCKWCMNLAAHFTTIYSTQLSSNTGMTTKYNT
jgi:hypothetical protein